jgi:hypothetical protein
MTHPTHTQPGAPVHPDALPRETLRLGQFLMAFGAIGLTSLMLCRLFSPQGSARDAVQFAAFGMSAWPLLLGSAMTEIAGVPGRRRTLARALLVLAAGYLLGRLLLSSMH